MTQDQLFSSQSSSNDMGSKGEAFALDYEHKRLPSFMHDRIVHLGHYEVARGYDILSCESKDSILPDRYIEVKTYKGHPHFYWTDNEIAAARKYADHYYLYLIDIDRISDPTYEPTIIPNPAILFNEDSQWSYQVQQYVFTLKSNEQIPDDWDDSSILLGCFNNEQHLRWILNHNLYNVRAQKDSPGAININNPQVQQAKYMLLYSVSNPRVYMLYALEPQPYRVSKTEMIALDYPNPHAFSYILHPIKGRIDSFHIDLTSLLREVNHTQDRTYGTPVYLNGTQLRRFMASDNKEQRQKINSGYDSPRNQWTQEQDDILREKFHKAVDFEDIAKQLGHTSKEVVHRAYQLGLIKPKN